MMWLMLAQAIVAASGPVPIESEAQAKAMTPQALADALLAPGHPPVDHARVVASDSGAPSPPGGPPRFEVLFGTAPKPAEPGYCSRMTGKVIVTGPGDGATAKLAWSAVRHRLGTRCAGGEAVYGSYRDAGARQAIRALDAARRQEPAFEVDYVDGLPADHAVPRYGSGMEALRAVPLEEIVNAGEVTRSDSFLFKRLPPSNGRVVEFSAGQLWAGFVVHDGERITHVVLHRRYPPPF